MSDEVPVPAPVSAPQLCIPPGIQAAALRQSVQKNAVFYIVLLVCVCALARAGERSFTCTLFTVIVTSFLAFYINYGYNCLFFQPWYETIDTMLTRWSVLYSLIHQPAKTVNTPLNPLHWSTLGGSALKAGGVLLLLKYILNLTDTKTILFWALMYPSVHNINYYFLKPRAHMEHHVYPHSNYGIDIWDLVFGTKHNWTDIEVHNHAAINSVVITALILSVSKYMGW